MKETTNRQPLNITATATAAELYTAAEIACSIALRTLHSKTGLQMYADLIRAYHNDHAARAAAEIQTTITAAEEIRDDCRKMARAAAQVAARLTITDEEREAAQDEAAAWSRAADQAADEAQTTAEALHGVTFSDRADMTQAAAAALVETWTTPAEVTEKRRADYAAAIGKTADELTADEETDLQTAANFRAAINAARRESTALAHPDAMTAHTTKSRKVTDEEQQAWIDTMGGTGADIRRPALRKNTKATDCFDTMEYKNTKRAPGWYLIRHYRTIRPYDSLEAATEATGNEPTADTLTDNEAATEAIAAIVSRANLTTAERAALAFYSIELAEKPTEADRNTAEAVTAKAEAARREYLTKRAGAIAKLPQSRQAEAIRAAQHTAANKATAARWNAALTAAGYKSERSRQRAQAAIIAALLGAAEKPSGIYYTTTEPNRRPDLIAAIEAATAATEAAAAVAWKNSRTLEAAAPCVTGWRERWTKNAAESAAVISRHHIEESRRRRGLPVIDNTTAEAAQKAAEAAARYAEKYAAAERTAAERAATAAKADRLAKAKAAAIRANVFTNSTNWEQWQTWSEAQREIYMEYLTARTA